MDFVRCIKTALLLIVAVTCIACKAKQDKPGASGSTPQETAPQASSVSTAVPPQDLTDARSAAVHALALFEAGDFQSIYKDAASGFKQIGSESQFVAKFNQTRQKVGVLKNPKEISKGMRPDKSIVLVYRVENERFVTDMRLTFARSQSGKMQLAGLNQHDEPKK